MDSSQCYFISKLLRIQSTLQYSRRGELSEREINENLSDFSDDDENRTRPSVGIIKDHGKR